MSESGARPGPAGGGRYQRSAAGLVIALVITVLAVTGFVAARSLLSNDLEVGPEPVDHLAAVRQAQDGGLEPAYLPELPDGWQATGVEIVAGDRPGFALKLLTDDDRFIGIRQEDESADDLVDTFIDEDASEDEEVDVAGSLAPSWETYSDEGGDLGYAAEVDGLTVLVYGSAGRDDVESVVAALTTRPLPDPPASPAG